VKTPRPADPRPQLHVDSLEEDRWTWRYVEQETGVELHSNETFSSRDVAVDWARRAYPDVLFADDEGGVGEAGEGDAGEGDEEGDDS
jgi:hypothetical protein